VLFFYFQNIPDVKYVANNSLVQFQIWDFPGDFQFTDQVALGNQGMFFFWLNVFRNCMSFGHSSPIVVFRL